MLSLNKKLLSLLIIIQIFFSFEASSSDFNSNNTSSDIEMNKEIVKTIYGIINYTKWNKNEKNNGTNTNEKQYSTPINVCVVNECPISSTIKLVEPNEKYEWSPNLIFLNSGEDLINENCNVLYFGSTFDSIQLSDINLTNSDILTISDHEDFIQNGGLIELRKDNNNIKFIINNKEIQKKNFLLDPELIQIGSEE